MVFLALYFIYCLVVVNVVVVVVFNVVATAPLSNAVTFCCSFGIGALLSLLPLLLLFLSLLLLFLLFLLFLLLLLINSDLRRRYYIHKLATSAYLSINNKG